MKTIAMTGKQILEIPMRSNDSGASTIRGYMRALLTELFDSGEGFSGKRPFGNSGWEGDIEVALVEAGCVSGTLYDESGEPFQAGSDDYPSIDTIDEEAKDEAIRKAIAAL